MTRHLHATTALALALLACAHAAATAEVTPGAADGAATAAGERDEATDEPAVITADELIFDESLNVVVARGNVEISQGARIVRADMVTYSPETKVVTATGNVTLIEPNGDIFFASYAELTDDLANGFVETVSMLLTDDSRLIGNSGLRTAGERTEIDRAVYSPCDLCAEDPRRPPLWQIRAVKVVHDGVTRDVIYRDAFLDLFGIPILYTPYLSHPDPTVEQRSGFLAPRFGRTSSVGAFAQGEYYWGISPDMDAIIGAQVTSGEGVRAIGEFRKRFVGGELRLEGSANYGERVDFQDGSRVERDDGLRWHLFGTLRYDLDENWRLGANLERSSDDTYLEDFDITGEDVLTSTAFSEGFYGLSYIGINAYSWQDLRRRDVQQPEVLPWVEAEYRTEPGSLFGGQGFVQGDLVGLYRDSDAGFVSTPVDYVDTMRLSTTVGWTRETIADFGLLTRFSAKARGDAYWSNDLFDEDDDEDDGSATAFRFFPVASAVTSYPFIGDFGNGYRPLIEPVVGFTLSPDIDVDEDIPNNDSLDTELDQNNLFDDDRVPGLDVIEGGPRVTYGIRIGLFDSAGGASTLFLGQSYRFTESDAFPEGSGLEDNQSDFVGRLSLEPAPWLDLDWSFRFDQSTFDARRHDLTMTGGTARFSPRVTYTFVESEGEVLSEDIEELRVGFTSQIDEYWRITANATGDLEADEMRQISVGAIYEDECFIFSTAVRRDYADSEEDGDDLTVLFSIGLRNLGTIPLQLDAGRVLEAGD